MKVTGSRPVESTILRDDAAVAEESHKLLVVGANPAPATRQFYRKFCPLGSATKTYKKGYARLVQSVEQVICNH